MLPLALFLAFLLLPVLEIYVIIQVGGLIGAGPTVVLLLAESLLGAWIVRREGRRAWRALQRSLEHAEMPDRQLLDGALVLVGGALLLTPGFVTDAVGFLFVLPPTRPLVRRAMVAYFTRRMRIARLRAERVARGGGEPDQSGPVIRGEIIREDRGE